MHNKEAPAKLREQIAKGCSLGLLIFVLVSIRLATPAHAFASDNWAIGAYYDYSGSGSSDFTADIFNNGMPAVSNAGPTFAVLTASVEGTSEFLPQIAIETVDDTNNVGPFLFATLLLSNGATDTNFNNGGAGCNMCGYYNISLSGLTDAWHKIELKLTSTVAGGINYGFIDYDLDGSQYASWQYDSCTAPCTLPTYDVWVVPELSVESYDSTNSDFSSLDVHGYLQDAGTNLGNIYLYPANWGADTSSGYGDCPVPSTVQASGSWPGTYIARLYEAPSNADVTGHIYDGTTGGGWGATDEWGIGIGDTNGYTDITDSQLGSTLCSSGPPQLA